MVDPYKTPESDLGTKEVIAKKSILWKIYFFFITILSVSGMGFILFSEGSGFVDVVEAVLILIAITGMFGFVFSKKVLTPNFWVPFLVIYLITGIVYESLSNVDIRLGMSDIEYYINLMVGYIISIPSYYSLYCYGNKNNYPWTKE